MSDRWPQGYPEPGIEVGSYRSSEDHLWDELRRIDYLVRGQVARWRLMIAQVKPERLWGMIHVTEAEVETYLHSVFTPPQALSYELDRALEPFRAMAAEIARRIAQSCAMTSPGVELRLERLKKLFHLSNLERDALLVCLLPELDGRYRRLFGYLQDDATRTRPSVELVMQILGPVASRPLVTRGPFQAGSQLLAHHLVTVAGGDEPLPVRSVRAEDRIVNYLLSGDGLDGRLVGVVDDTQVRVSWDDLTTDPERVERLRAWVAWWRYRRWKAGAGVARRAGKVRRREDLAADFERLRRLKTWAPWWRHQRRKVSAGAVWLLHGPSGNGQLAAARALCTAIETPLLVVDTGRALRAAAGWELVVDLCIREASLRGAALYWSGCQALLQADQPPHRWEHLVNQAERFSGLIFLESSTDWEPSGRFRQRLFLRLDFPPPNYDLRRRLWQKHLPPADSFAPPPPDRAQLVEALTNAFQMTEGQVHDAVAASHSLAVARDPDLPLLLVDDLYEGSRRQSNQRLMTFARRIVPRTTLGFDDLILPPANKLQIEELRQRIRLRSRVVSGLGFENRMTMGKGFVALFTGSSGTGKTMAAELLAHEQGVELFKVDLSAVVSKWVGETEKNLSIVFTEAESSSAVLLFDECEALFSKRGEVKEARDRWANLEASYLLQRIEEYSGVVILTSNFRQNIDEAFLRRIHAIVEFPFPDRTNSPRIWLGMFPPGLERPLDDDVTDLAQRCQLSGGSIRNVVLNAAFRALADAGDSKPTITMHHLVLAAAREYQKLGKPITKADFGQPYYGWIEETIL
jgi:AAA+ superfamily predicted ATPase